MAKLELKEFSWGSYFKVFIVSYCLLQILRWRILPQFMDIYYHLLCAWGFIQAGGYSAWDFWQYAPVGRAHIYPPFFHLVLALFLKLGFPAVILAKTCETITPLCFIFALWHFIKKNYNERLALFVLVAFSSSYSFYLSLINNIPATLAFIFGIFAFDQLFKGKLLRPILLLALSFYTHLSVSWFLIFSIIIYSLWQPKRKRSLLVCFSAVILALPILSRELLAFKDISVSASNEKFFCEFKPVDYLLALFSFILISRGLKRYRFFLSLFLGSFTFLAYPYRFFSAQGYFPIILATAVALEFLYDKFKDGKNILRYLSFLLCLFMLFVSPTILTEKKEGGLKFKFYLLDSTPSNLIFPLKNIRIASTSLWYPQEYLGAAEIIKRNSGKSDIIYSKYHFVGVCLASLSGRATANALFNEVSPAERFNPFLTSRIIVVNKDEFPAKVNYLVSKFNILKAGETEIFTLYRNPSCTAKMEVNKAIVPFRVLGIIALVYLILLLL